MSLDFNLSKIANFKTVCYDEHGIHPVTKVVIFSCIVVDMGEIKDVHDVDEFMWRARVMTATDGSHLIAAPHKRNLTEEELMQHIGLSTNVSTLTRAKFLQKVKRARDYESKQARRRHEERNG